MDKSYNHKEHEEKIYKMWEKGGYFNPDNSEASETFSVLMPPPNANAPLHCGHATYSIQDIMARYMRMKGKKVLYLPGTDHAGFETQVVYERNLKKLGKSRFDFDSKTLYSNILDFVKENSDVAINQLRRIGMSADWSRNTFMLAPHVIDTVYNTFEKMYADGLVYRDYYMVNYSVYHGTTFSNLETTHIESVSPLYYVRYQIVDSDNYITVATVRPETIYADVAIAVNPKDKKYKDLIGQSVINPLTDKVIPIIADRYVDMEFGTGALKITPGHDFADFEIGKKHNLEIISLINLDGKMNEHAPEIEGLFVTKARIKAAEILKERDTIERIDETYTNNLLVDYKDNKPIEPMVLPNWFIRMEGLAAKAQKAIKDDRVHFNKKMWKRDILRWLDDIRDWPISRQIVFGIRIPAWYSTKENSDLHVSFLNKKGEKVEGEIAELFKDGYGLTEINDGLQKIIANKSASFKISKKSPGDEYIQETDTFDTWFSSGQWPLTTLHYPKGEDFKTFFPTGFMDTMWDILFFWIARMIMFSLYLVDEVPFENVYIHGMITDQNGKKMSKSLGNVINPMEFVEKYGADALRMGIIVGGNTAAKSTALSEDKVRGYRNFANKLWNMARFMNMMFESYTEETHKHVDFYSDDMERRLSKEDKEILATLNKTIKKVDSSLGKYRFADAGEAIYHFMWNGVANVYLEDVKNRSDKDIALSVFRHVYINGIKLLHPFMPFVTEAIWENIPGITEKALIVSTWPTAESVN